MFHHAVVLSELPSNALQRVFNLLRFHMHTELATTKCAFAKGRNGADPFDYPEIQNAYSMAL
jgi:hypothetical protein